MQDLLKAKRDALIKSWVDYTISSYGEESARVLSRNKDPFANPLRSAIVQTASGLVDFLMDANEEASLKAIVDPAIRIRALQDFSPSQAVGFIFGFKQIVRKLVPDLSADALEELDQAIDRIALVAFDVYTACREKVWEVRATELRKRTEKAMARMNIHVREYVTEPGSDDEPS